MGLTMQDPGCCCGGCTTTVCVTGCGGNPEGVTITITTDPGGAPVSSGVTGSGGCVTLPIPSAGFYHVVASGGGFASNSNNHNLTCGGTLSIALSVGTGFACCSGFAGVLPTTLFITTCGSTYTLTATPVGGFITGWGITVLLSVADVASTIVACNWIDAPATITSDVQVNITVSCPTGTPPAATFVCEISCLTEQSTGTFTWSLFPFGGDCTTCSTLASNCQNAFNQQNLTGTAVGGIVSATGTVGTTFTAGGGVGVPGATEAVPPCSGDAITVTS